MKLITENDFHDFELIIEEKNPSDPKFMRVRGPYIVSEEKNANNRTYKQKLMEQCVKEFNQNMIKTGRACGELNHPPHTNIDYDRACHRVTDLRQEGNIWIGESVILTSSPDGSIKGTVCGDTIASVLQHGGRPGMSTRGVGEISENNTIDKEYKLITIDCVSDPSGPGCFVEGILESKEFMINVHGEIVEKAINKFENGLMNIPTHSIKTNEGSEYIHKLFDDFIDNIKYNN